jgi:hypothetical protein
MMGVPRYRYILTDDRFLDRELVECVDGDLYMVSDFERVEIELKGLKDQVDRYWGSESTDISVTIVRAKAMLENSHWHKRDRPGLMYYEHSGSGI